MKKWWKGPVKTEPNFENLLMILKHKKPSRPTLFEFFLNDPLYEFLAGTPIVPDMDKYEYCRILCKAFRNAGYDYATIHVMSFGFPAKQRSHEKTVSLNEGFVITNWEEFEKYQWQNPKESDYDFLDKLGKEIPAGMKLIIPCPGGVLENLITLTGYDNICYLLADNPSLIKSICDAIGSRLVKHCQLVLQHESVGAIIGNDDRGFKTQPMLSPEAMRKYIIPWHKKIVEIIHQAGKPAIMHSCGNLELLMDDIINVIKYDGKHSYEDTILPVESFYSKYGRKIAVLGGIDVDFIVRSTPEEIYKRSSKMLEIASDFGSYALGTGNSVPEYIPWDNYFAMISAAVESRQ